MTDNIIAYRRTGTNQYMPVPERKPGMIVTAAIMFCSECSVCIDSGGGGGQYLCPECYQNFKLVNFTEGNDPVCK